MRREVQGRMVLATILLLLSTVTAMVAEPAEAFQPRRLVVCLDGTQNSPEQDVGLVYGHKLYKPTNVLKTFRAIRPVDDYGVSQIAYYSEGVGSMIGDSTGYARFEMLVDKIFGGAFGVGYEPRVKSAYRFLVANYQPGDHIFVFGFSRGAAEAQTLVRFIEWVGGILEKTHEYWIPELYEGFRRSQMKPHCHAAPGTVAEVTGAIRKRHSAGIGQVREARIEFLGVYDTVVSVGSRLAPDGSVTTVAGKYAYLVDRNPPGIVKTIRQGLAIDERRWDFRPQIWQPDDPKPQQDGVKPLVQLWFPGVHSNVGGSIDPDDLANGALKWLVHEAEIAGLSVDHCYLAFYETGKDPRSGPARPDSNTLSAQIADLIRLKRGRGVRRLATWDDQLGSWGTWEKSGLGFHESLGRLLIRDSTYRPKNLLEYLARNPNRIDEFPMSQQPAICQIVRNFNAKLRTPNSGQASPCETAAARN